MKQGSYQFEELEDRHVEAAFLAERARMRLDGFIDLLIRHQFPPEGKILEVGSAQGLRTELMAKNFPKAQVIGIDRSPELLKQESSLPNLSFLQADLYDLPFEDESFDFIYARLVFMHLTNPTEALQSLRRLLKPGGKILIEDADRDCMHFEPAPQSFPGFWKKVQEGQRRLGGDPNVGRRLAPFLKESGFKNVNIEIQSLTGAGPEIEFLARTLMPSLNIYLDPLDRAAGQLAINDLHELSRDPRASFYHFWFVVSGAKP